jgi:hypothetical protein
VPKEREFLFAGETCYDWEIEVYHLSYQRSENKQYIPLSRYMLPHMPFMTAVTGFNDRNMINQCLLYKYIVSYEPYNFKGRLEDYPMTLEYGQRMDELRTELKDYFWHGEFRDKCGAEVTTLEGKTHHPYSVFTNHEDGSPGVVIVNYENEEVTVQLKLEQGTNKGRYRLIDNSNWKSTKEGIALPPRSAAVVI